MAPFTASAAAVVAAVAVAIATTAAVRPVGGTTVAAAAAAVGATSAPTPRLLPLLSIDHFALVNADTDTVVRRLANGDTIGGGCYAFNIVAGWDAPALSAAADGGGDKSSADGRARQCGRAGRPGVAPNVTYTSPFWHTEKFAPYALGKDTKGDYWALRRLPLGPTTIRAFVGGDRHLVTEVNVTVVAPVCGA